MKYKKYYDALYSIYLTKLPSDELYQEYFDYFPSNDGEGSLKMQEFVNLNLKEEYYFLTGLSIIESIDNMINESLSNGNIKK